MLTYWLAGGLDIFLLSTFWAPLHYASSQMGMAAAFQGQVANWMHYMRDLRETTFIFVPATLLIARDSSRTPSTVRQKCFGGTTVS